jgi:hypothetical protein
MMMESSIHVRTGMLPSTVSVQNEKRLLLGFVDRGGMRLFTSFL